MRREALFNRSGFYRFLLDTNVLMHREATTALSGLLSELAVQIPVDRPLRVLDLACGGWPLSIAQAMQAFPGRGFDYTGVDINPDQVELASDLFEFPANVRSIQVLEGNAWDLEARGLTPGFNLIYSGLNLHHGVPEEVEFLAQQLADLLAPNGCFLSHDVYRPEGTTYLRRPDVNPADSSESFRLLEPRRLAVAGIAVSAQVSDDHGEEPAWRMDYIERMRKLLIARGGDTEGAESTANHMRQRDYPISLGEFRAIFEPLGYGVTTGRYEGSAEPMGPYIGLCTARPMN